MRAAASAVAAVLLLTACASQPTASRVETRDETVGYQRLTMDDAGGAGAVQAYTLQPGEGYRMPQLYAGPDPVVGERDPRRELAPTTVCLQVVVTAEGTVERSAAVTDRSGCAAGGSAENQGLVQAAQEAVAAWRYTPAAVCHFAAGKTPADLGDCRDAERIAPVPVSLFYAFTFEIVKGEHVVHRR